MIRRRTILLGTAFLLCAAGLFAIGVLAFGHFGKREGQIIGTTAILAGCALLALPAVALVERRSLRAVAVANAVTSALAAVAGVVAVWWSGDLQGRLSGTAVVVAVASTQAAALAARRDPRDSRLVRALFAASLVTAAVAATMIVTTIWAEIDTSGYARALGSVVILDVVVVALQPLLARLRPPEEHFALELTLDEGDTRPVDVDAPDLGEAAARAIHDAERRGEHVHGLRVG